jgi:hypothetical protein
MEKWHILVKKGMESNFLCKMKSKGMSQIMGAAVLIALTFMAFTIVATQTNLFVKDTLDGAQSCFELVDQIEINEDYTCYNPVTHVAQVSLTIHEADIESVLVALNYGEGSFTFRLENHLQEIPLVRNYPDNGSEIKLPGKESGKTYFIYGVPEEPLKIQIAPRTAEKQCEVVDYMENILPC